MGVKLLYFFLAYWSSFYGHRRVYPFLLILTILDLCFTRSQYGFPCIVATPNEANIPFFCGFLCCHIFKHIWTPIAYFQEYIRRVLSVLLLLSAWFLPARHPALLLYSVAAALKLLWLPPFRIRKSFQSHFRNFSFANTAFTLFSLLANSTSPSKNSFSSLLVKPIC